MANRVYHLGVRRCTRREFNTILIGTAAGLCSGCGGATTVTPSGNRVFLAYARFPALTAAGGAAVVDVQGRFPIVVVRTATASATALSATCTHEACILAYDRGANDLHCDCHGADFDLSGAVLRGPTVVPLPVYAATVQTDGITVDLS